MEEFITSYGLEFPVFREKMIAGKAIVAGSSALALYLKQEGVEPGFSPNDIDIFITSPSELGESCRFISFLNHKVVGQLAYFFIRSGYNVTRTHEQKENNYENVSGITCILCFEHPFLKTTIQLICLRSKDVVQAIQESFDLTACMTWWDPSTTDRMQTRCSESTRQKKTYDVKGYQTEKAVLRRQKYKERGFEFLRSPPRCLHQTDSRAGLGRDDCEFIGKTAFDCIHQEDVEIVPFLQKSPWNILLRTGETDYAFDRAILTAYLDSKQMLDSQGRTVFSTPFRQMLTEEQRWAIDCSDWSIFDIRPSVECSSYYHLTCYSLGDSVEATSEGEIGPFDFMEYHRNIKLKINIPTQ